MFVCEHRITGFIWKLFYGCRKTEIFAAAFYILTQYRKLLQIFYDTKARRRDTQDLPVVPQV